MRPDGSDPERLTSLRGSSINPAWSPDSRIVFASNIVGSLYALYMVGVAGSAVHRLRRRSDSSARLVARRVDDRPRRTERSPRWSWGSDDELTDTTTTTRPDVDPAAAGGLRSERPVTLVRVHGVIPSRTAARISLSVAAFCSASASTSSAIRLRRDHDAVVVTDDPVTRLDPHIADRHGYLRRLQLPAPASSPPA